ncbi:MAG: thioredoxin family protein [Gemmatimonadota bacterium]|nr:thioredoxin family protein [Gemmatimonadota bacterium]
MSAEHPARDTPSVTDDFCDDPCLERRAVNAALPLRDRWARAETFEHLLERVTINRELWQALASRATVAPSAIERARALPGRWHLLVLTEDWCGDSVNTLPVLARLVAGAPNLEMRLLGRDENPDIMNSHLSRGSRSIPVVMLLDDDFVERGWWGSRPGPLQQWVVGTGLPLSREERYREVRKWYARDHGATAVDEMLSLLERGATRHLP